MNLFFLVWFFGFGVLFKFFLNHFLETCFTIQFSQIHTHSFTPKQNGSRDHRSFMNAYSHSWSTVTSDIWSKPLTTARKKLPVALVKITKPYCDVTMFSAAAITLTAPVWFLSGTISTVSFHSFSLQQSLMEPLGSSPLRRHHTTALYWHQTAQTKQTHC